jgi:predicted TPR repeat methyltransferase
MTNLHSSGDLVVDRRFLYARAAAAAGDHAAAAEVLVQTLDLEPGWAPLWMALGESLGELDRSEEAVAAFERAADLDASGILGAALHLARLGARPVPAAPPEPYVRALFDDYADHFEAHLTGPLAYRGPELLARALAPLGAMQFPTVVDLGCGTGLCGARLRRASVHLAGVDVSPRMVAAARAKNIYDRLAVASNADFLRAEPERSADLVLAADVLVYSGCLAPILAAVRRVLSPGGRFAFTLQRAGSGAYRIGADLRYAHGEDYVTEAVRGAGLTILLLEQATARIEAGEAVPGLVVVAA